MLLYQRMRKEKDGTVYHDSLCTVLFCIERRYYEHRRYYVKFTNFSSRISNRICDYLCPVYEKIKIKEKEKREVANLLDKLRGGGK